MHIGSKVMPFQDTEFQIKRGNLTLTQAVPNSKWFLVPSPAIKVRCLLRSQC